MEAGKLRHRIAIQKKTVSPDTEGIPMETWNDFAVMWSAVNPLSGKEFWEAQAVNQANIVRFRIRYISGIHSSMRIVYNNRIFQILSIIDVEERHQELQIMGQEVL
jgi:SPP1 family predicted phage head-tail adaptor